MRKGKLAISVYIVLSIVLASFVVNIEDGFGIKKAGATTTTININATDDALIDEYLPDNNYWNDSLLKARNSYHDDGPGYAYDSIVKFNLSTLPSGCIINSAILKLWYSGYPAPKHNPAGRPLRAYRITQDWNEHNVTWNAQPVYTYNPTDSTNVPTAPGVWMEWNVTNDIQDFANGTVNHFGYRIADETYWGKAYIPIAYLSSKEGGHIPHLIIGYEGVITQPDVVYVDDDYTPATAGWGYDHFDVIQDGIDAVAEGGTVYVYDGTYIEELGPYLRYVEIYKSLSLIGESEESTIIDCPSTGSDEIGIFIDTGLDNVTISEFTVSGHSPTDSGASGIYPQPNCRNITIENCIVHSFNEGIKFRYSCSNSIIRNCTTYNNNRRGGICLLEWNYSNIEISGCTTYANSHGINIADAVNCTISGNIITNNTLGISLDSSNRNTIMGNTITNNTRGIWITSCNNNTIAENTVTNSDWRAIFLEQFCNENKIYHNNFIVGNYDNGVNTWDNGYPSGGNYWGNYIATDYYCGVNQDIPGSDGIGDIPYNISAGENQDRYPLMYPFGENNPPIANFTWTPKEPTNLEMVTFIDLSDDTDGSIINWTWDFGDQTIAYGKNVDHLYTTNGNYTITLNIIDNDDFSATITKTIHVKKTNIVEFQGLEPLYTTEYIEIAITIDPEEAIAGVQFDLSFDPDMLSIDWVAEGNVFSGYDTYFDGGVIDDINGTLKNVVALITTPNGSTTDQGSIAIVAIRAKTIPGETPLNLSNVVVGSPDGSPVPLTIINSSVTVIYEPWDINGDSHTNILDLILIAQHWGETGTPCWIPADVNCDGVINILDMVLVGQHWTG